MRGDPNAGDPGVGHRVYGTKKDASFQVIILGSNGGPREDTVTGLLVRAPQAEWRKSSIIAVDAGVHLASIIGILQKYMPYRSDKIATPGQVKVLKEGPFAGVSFPYISAKANALYIFRELLHSFLITHPHLDHIAAMGINTPALEFGREAKAIVALPPVIEAIKAHIFNDSIWPNLSDEAHGVGFVTYRRLTEGGNLRLGSGDARGYVSVCDGLATKCLSVTHGKCQRHNHSMSHQRGESGGWFPNDYNFQSRRLSRMSDDHGYFAAMAQQQAYNVGMHIPGQMQMPPAPLTPGIGGGPGSVAGMDKDYSQEPVTSSAFFIKNEVTGREILVFGDIEPDSVSIAPRNHVVWDEAAPKIDMGILKAIFIECSYDNSVRDADLFGHLCPRHLIAELYNLARRVMSFRERKSEPPRSSIVSPTVPSMNLKEPPSPADLTRKRKRVNGSLPGSADPDPSPRLRPSDPPPFPTGQYVGLRSATQTNRRTSRETGIGSQSPLQRPVTPSRIPRHVQFQESPRPQHGFPQSHTDPVTAAVAAAAAAAAGTTDYGTTTNNNHNLHLQTHHPSISSVQQQSVPGTAADLETKEPLPNPLKGLTIHIIHVKDTMVDGPAPGKIVAEELHSLATEIGLGCDFDVTDCGESIWI